MKLITYQNEPHYYGDEEVGFENGILKAGEVYYSRCLETGAQVYENPTVPDDFSIFKYDYDGTDFYEASRHRERCEEQRTERDALLAETDWWAVSDRTMTQAETDYRQALRDVPQQEGFPIDITWPTKP